MKTILFILLTFITNLLFAQITINIQPLGDVNNDYLTIIENSIQDFYGFNTKILPKSNLTKDLLAKSKTRYDADKILDKFNSNQYTIVITQKDIATPKNQYPEWGIFGLGFMPGKVCVVSTHRLIVKNNRVKTSDRLIKVTLHEIGHNLGLDHCDNHPQCIMNDARGTIKQVDSEIVWMCDKCKSMIY